MKVRVGTYIKLRKLRASDRATTKTYDALRKRAKAENKSTTELHEIDREEHFERSIDWDQISKLNSSVVCREATRLGVPIPRSDEMWEESNVIGGRYLSEKGFSELRSALRKEKNERWAYWELRLKVTVGFLTALTGVAGALIGLAAVLGLKWNR